ncbi:MAG: hypothetical protein WC150_12450 [Bacteroidia bacterium]
MIVTDSCKHEYEEITVVEGVASIRLRWNKSHAGETQSDVETALKWALSYLGAELPAGSFARTLQWEGERVMLVNYRCNCLKYEQMNLVLEEWLPIAEFHKNMEHIIEPDVLTGEIMVACVD